jgi:hypothetical protein
MEEVRLEKALEAVIDDLVSEMGKEQPTALSF